MRLTVLGRSPAIPNPGEACAGHLIESGPTRLLVDIGPGVVAQLVRRHVPANLTAVVVSHMHSDHVLDLVTLRHAFPWLEAPARKLPIFLPPGSADQLTDLARAAGDVAFFEKTFEISEHDGKHELTFGTLSLRPMPTQHYVPTWGFRISENGRTLAYSADSGPCDPLIELAEDADAFLCEATLRTLEEDAKVPEQRGHLTAGEAGAAARAARARRLLLTHLPLFDGPASERATAEASSAFGRRAEVVEPLAAYEV